MSWLDELQKLPSGVQETTQLLRELDQCFLVGFARLAQTHFDSLAALQRIYAGTPLTQSLDDSITALSRSEFVEQHFMTLAVARASLQGAQYTALHNHIAQILGRSIEATENNPLPPVKNTDHGNTCHWLMELALTGLGQLDAQMVAPFQSTLSQVETTALHEPARFAQLALLTNFANELMQASTSPNLAIAEAIPISRWVDLWTRAMVGTLGHTPQSEPAPVSGTLYPLGIDLRQHGFTANVVVYALLDHAQQTQLVRINLSAYKVDAIRGDDIWLLFPQLTPLLTGISEGKSAMIQEMPLLPTGDLCWPLEESSLSFGPAYNLLDEAEKGLTTQNGSLLSSSRNSIAAIDRHPIQLAELIYVQDYKVNSDNELVHEGTSLPIAFERLPAHSELTHKVVASSNRMIGLLRFDDDQWRIQPLTVAKQASTKRPAKLTFTGQQGLKLLQKPPKNNVVETLQERASRLLRA